MPTMLRALLGVIASLILCGGIAGCAHDTGNSSDSSGSDAALPPLDIQPWIYDGKPAVQVQTSHYVIYTTISDRELLDKVGHVMERAYAEYSRFAPASPRSDAPMTCYLFLTRDQWAQFTRHYTGSDAAVYLHINRGGYTIHDWYVAYFMGDVGTFSVAAHEGFHQYASRNFKNRIPPFLEEGIACMFEDVRWKGNTPYWSLDINVGRLSSLRTAIDQRRLFPLDQLAMTHAGQIVNGPPGRIAAFYGQSWAFARFCREAEKGKYRQGLQDMLSDAAAGKLFAATRLRPGVFVWDPKSAPSQLEHYFREDIATLDRHFRAYMSGLVNRQVAEENNS